MSVSASTREERIEQDKKRKRIEHIKMLAADFATQVPGEYRKFGLSLLTEGDKNWGGSLDRSDALQMSRYLKDPTKFLILSGPAGTGKSSASYAVASQLVLRYGAAAKFVSAATMLSQFSFGSDIKKKTASDFLLEYSDVPILVIDDLGSANEGMSPHQERSLWSLIEARWSNKRRTIINTNMAISGNREGLGISELLGESAWDRIRDSLTFVTFDGESFRGSKRK